MTDFSESEASDDPEQEGAALDVRSAAKERRRIAPLKKTHTTDTNKRNKKRAMMMILCSFSICPYDALLARVAEKEKESLYYFEKRIVGLTDGLRGKYDYKPSRYTFGAFPFFDRRTTYLLLDSGRSVRIYGQSLGLRIYSSIR